MEGAAVVTRARARAVHVLCAYVHDIDWMSESSMAGALPEDVNRAYHRIASTGQHPMPQHATLSPACTARVGVA